MRKKNEILPDGARSADSHVELSETLPLVSEACAGFLISDSEQSKQFDIQLGDPEVSGLTPPDLTSPGLLMFY